MVKIFSRKRTEKLLASGRSIKDYAGNKLLRHRFTAYKLRRQNKPSVIVGYKGQEKNEHMLPRNANIYDIIHSYYITATRGVRKHSTRHR